MRTHTGDLFDDGDEPRELAPGASVLPGFASAVDKALLAAIERVRTAAPLRRVMTPGGQAMSVTMTNCGEFGWVSDRRGYRYETQDPESGLQWPSMPQELRDLAAAAASSAGYARFEPDACLINRYVPGARMSLHQDRDECDFSQPIVSVSLGLPAVFLLGGDRRADRPLRVALKHGDVVVFGGAARLRYHGILAVKPGQHELLGAQRLNLTFRRAH